MVQHHLLTSIWLATSDQGLSSPKTHSHEWTLAKPGKGKGEKALKQSISALSCWAKSPVTLSEHPRDAPTSPECPEIKQEISRVRRHFNQKEQPSADRTPKHTRSVPYSQDYP